MATVDMRGAAFFTFLEALKALRGPATEAAVRAALPDALREKLASGGLTRVGWYPLADYAALHTATDAVVHGGADFARQLGRTTTEIDTRGLIRYVLAIASPDLLMRHAAKVFSSYVRGASVASIELGPRHYELRWEGLVGATSLVHTEMQGGAAFLIERAGGKNVRVESAPPQSRPDHTLRSGGTEHACRSGSDQEHSPLGLLPVDEQLLGSPSLKHLFNESPSGHE